MRRLLRSSVCSIIIASVMTPTAASSEEEFIEELKAFVSDLRKDYTRTLTLSHEFMISLYYFNRGTDLQLASNVLTQWIASSRVDATNLASNQASLDLLVEDLKKGNAPRQAVLRSYRDAYFGQFESRRARHRLEAILLDIKKLGDAHSQFCAAENQDRAQLIFQPENYYASTVFTVIKPPPVDFGGYVQFSFDTQGNLTSATAGAGSGPQQLPNGFTEEEHEFAQGAGGVAIGISGALGAGAWAGPIGAAVSLIVYGIMSGIKNEDRVRAIEEQVDLMQEADAIHDETIAEIRDRVPSLTEKYCEVVVADPNIKGPVDSLTGFMNGNDSREFIAQLKDLEANAIESTRYLDEWLTINIGINPSAYLEAETEQALDEMAVQWTFEEQNARRFWSEKVNSVFLGLDGSVSSFRSSPEERSKALDALTWGDCRFALCYPLLDEEVPSELDPNVSLVWEWNRKRLEEAK